MAFESLGDKLQGVFKKLRGKGKLNEKDIKDAMREIKLALLEADVNFKVVKEFVNIVSEKALGQEIMESLTPAQQLVKIVNEELTQMIGGEVSRLEFSQKPPTVIMMCGLQGAGKTTLFRLLATLVAPDGGTASVDGLDIVADYKRIRERVGYMPGRFSLYPDLSVGENLAFFAALFGVEIAENYDLIAPIYRQIEPFRARRAGKLSGGMKQKLALCCALIHRPAVLLLDEPTTGVDAVSRSEFWDMLSELKGKGISMLVSTPYMDEAVRCDRVALCDGGKILAVDTPQGVVGRFDEPLYALAGDDMYGLLLEARRHADVKECYPFGQTHHLIAGEGFDAGRFVRETTARGFRRVTLRPVGAGIEDVFIKLMRHA